MSDTRSGAPNRDAGKEMVSASAMGETGTVLDSGYDKKSSVSVVRLVQVQTGGREEVAGPWCALNARAEVMTDRYVTNPLPPGSYGSYGPPSPTPISGSFSAWASYQAEMDSRGVTITRSGAPAPKQANDPTLKKELDEWIEPDGTGHGHSTYSYFYWQWSKPIGSGALPAPFKDHAPNAQSFMATYLDIWADTVYNMSNLDYSWNPSSSDDDRWSHRQEMPDGSVEKNLQGEWEGSPSGTSGKVVTLSVTDTTDGATARARYELTLHDPVEQKTRQMQRTRANIRPHPHRIWVTSTQDGQSLTVGVSQSHTWTVTVVLGTEIGISEWIAGVILQVEGGKSYTTETSVSATANNVPKDYGTYLEIYDVFKVHSGLADKWNAAGYAGTGPYEVKEPDGWGVQAAPPVYLGGGSP